MKSSDGQVFSLSLDVAKKFGTLHNMLQDLGHDVTNLDEVISLSKVNSRNAFYLINKENCWDINANPVIRVVRFLE